MPVTITGGKYGPAAISVVGTTTVTVSTAPFVSGDFAISRVMGLWTTAGAFKGIAFIRGFVATNQLELETAFFDPVNGAIQTQVIGDVILVSKNWAESVVAGITVSVNNVTCTDSIIFGTAGNNASVCFHDENKFITCSVGNPLISLAGGVVVFGHLQDYATSAVYGGCVINMQGGGGIRGMSPTSVNGNWFMYGGGYTSQNSPVWNGGFQGVPPNSQVYTKGFFNCDLIGNAADGSGNWTANASRQVVRECSFSIQALFAIALRWGLGVVEGGSFKCLTDGPISFFGSGLSYGIGAPKNKLLVIQDAKGATFGLYDKFVNAPSTVTWTNVVAPQRTVGRPTNVTTYNWRWLNSYTNLVNGTRAIIERAVDRVVAASALAANNEAVLDVLEQVQSGTVRTPPVTTDFSQWNYGLWLYGYEPLSGVINRTTYSLGTAGSSNYVSFGGFQNQLVDVGITDSLGAVLAYTSISTLNQLYDMSMAWKTAIDANAQYPLLSTKVIARSGDVLDLANRNITLNPASLAVFDVNTVSNTITIKSTTLAVGSKFTELVTTGTISFSGASTATCRLSGQITLSTPGVVSLSLGTATLRFSVAGTYNLRTSNISGSVTLINTSGSPVTVQLSPGVTFVNSGPNITVDNSVISDISVTGLIAGSRLQVFNVTKSLETYNSIVAGTSYTAQYTGTAQYAPGDILRIRATRVSGTTAYLGFQTSAQVGALGWSVLVAQVLDPVYNEIGIDGSLVTEFLGDVPNVQIDIDDPDNVTTLERLYAWFSFNQNTSAGIASFFGGITASDRANYNINGGLIDLSFDNRKTTMLTIGGGYITKTGGSPSLVAPLTIGSIYFASGRAYIAASESIVTNVSAIKAKTDALPADPASNTQVNTRLAAAGYTVPPTAVEVRQEIDLNSTKLDVNVGSRLAASSYVPGGGASAADVWAHADRTLTGIGASGIAAQSDLSLVKAKTDNLPPQPANQVDLIDIKNNTNLIPGLF